jgi:hypothetical protein
VGCVSRFFLFCKFCGLGVRVGRTHGVSRSLFPLLVYFVYLALHRVIYPGGNQIFDNATTVVMPVQEAGNFKYVVLGSGGCVKTLTEVVSGPTTFSPEYTVEDQSCSGVPDGSISFNDQGMWRA